MKIFMILLYFICSTSLFGQTNQQTQKGNYFASKSGDYFKKVIRPWKYQYIKTQTGDSIGAVKKIGEITFWRSEAIYDEVSKKYWKPDIRFDIYLASDSNYVRRLAKEIKLVSSCDSINKGGDVLLLGHFILVSSSACVNCSSSSNIDYCRKIVKHILESVSNKDTYNWDAILKQFIIEKEQFKS